MPRLSVPKLMALKGERPIVMLTAYDAASARLADAVSDVLLVGDSLGHVIQGHDTTLQVTMEQMLYHTRIVSENSSRALLVGDMPFLSYQTSARDAVLNAGRFLKEAGAMAVKLEGGVRSIDAVRAILAADIPVMGHIGFTPQSAHKVGEKRVARDEGALLEDAKTLEDAGIFSLVLECVPRAIAVRITKAVSIPTIGIGAGPECDGQVLVFHDVLGFSPEKKLTFVKRYMDFNGLAGKALAEFRDDVLNGRFPADENSFR